MESLSERKAHSVFETNCMGARRFESSLSQRGRFQTMVFSLL